MLCPHASLKFKIESPVPLVIIPVLQGVHKYAEFVSFLQILSSLSAKMTAVREIQILMALFNLYLALERVEGFRSCTKLNFIFINQ